MTLTPRQQVITDAQWERVSHLFPDHTGRKGRPYEGDHRTTVEAALYILRKGIPWRDLPQEFGNPNTVYYRFYRWSKSGLFRKMFETVASEHSLEIIMVDSTFVRVHQKATGARRRGLTFAESRTAQAIGKTPGGLNTKITAFTNRYGEVVDFTLLPGNRNDMKALLPTFSNLNHEMVREFMADKGYDSNEIRYWMYQRGITVSMPVRDFRRRPDIPYNKQSYKARHLVENVFADLKENRGIATRYCKHAMTFEAMVSLAIWHRDTRPTRRGESIHHRGYTPFTPAESGQYHPLPKKTHHARPRPGKPEMVSVPVEALYDDHERRLALRRLQRAQNRAAEPEWKYNKRLEQRRERRRRRKEQEGE